MTLMLRTRTTETVGAGHPTRFKKNSVSPPALYLLFIGAKNEHTC